jgi:tetratricopeptide (TPR) repeat protein
MKNKTRKQRFRQLQAVVNQGLNASVIELAQEYLRDFPKAGLVWLDYGNALINFRKYDEARVALLRAMKHMRPEHMHFPHGSMGYLYECKGEYRKAAEWFGKAAKMAPADATYLIFLGAVLVKAGKLSEAMKCHRRAVKCKEGAIDEAYYNLGGILGALGRYKEALTCFEKAIDLDPKYKLAKQAAKDMRGVLEIKATSNKACS